MVIDGNRSVFLKDCSGCRYKVNRWLKAGRGSVGRLTQLSRQEMVMAWTRWWWQVVRSGQKGMMVKTWAEKERVRDDSSFGFRQGQKGGHSQKLC